MRRCARANSYFPDGRADIETEVRRYKMLRFSSFVGFKPPYFYNRSLAQRLYRAAMPSLVLWGEADHMVPVAHGEAFALRACRLRWLAPDRRRRPCVVLEAPGVVADGVLGLLAERSGDRRQAQSNGRSKL